MLDLHLDKIWLREFLSLLPNTQVLVQISVDYTGEALREIMCRQ